MVERIHVLVNKEQIRPEALEETVVVMDVMLATTTMITILERGASRSIPSAAWRRPGLFANSWAPKMC